MSKRKYLFFIPVILLISLTIINYFRIIRNPRMNEKNSSSNIHTEKNNTAYIKLKGIRVDNFLLKKIISNERIYTDFSNLNLVVFLSNVACNPCQIKELELIKVHYSELIKKMKVWIIYIGFDEKEIYYLKKICELNDDISLYTTNRTATNSFYSYEKYPLVLLIQDNTILNAHIPIYGDEVLSESFYKNLLKTVY